MKNTLAIYPGKMKPDELNNLVRQNIIMEVCTS